jgi:hypothetical protein
MKTSIRKMKRVRELQAKQFRLWGKKPPEVLPTKEVRELERLVSRFAPFTDGIGFRQ